MSAKKASEWKDISLADLLTDEQIAHVCELLNRNTPEKFKLLRAYLCLHREQLETRGVLPEYLGYYLEYAYNEGQLK